MQKIIQILFTTLPEAADVCSAAEMLIPWIKGEIVAQLPPLLGQQVALRPQLSLLEMFTPIRSAHAQPVVTSSALSS